MDGLTIVLNLFDIGSAGEVTPRSRDHYRQHGLALFGPLQEHRQPRKHCFAERVLRLQDGATYRGGLQVAGGGEARRVSKGSPLKEPTAAEKGTNTPPAMTWGDVRCDTRRVGWK